MPVITVASVDALSDIAGGLPASARARLVATQLGDGSVSVDVPDDIASAFQALVADPAPGAKARLTAYAAARRYAVETGGCAWSGHTVQTDRESQSKLIAQFVAIGASLRTDPSPWKMADGFASLTNAQMLAVIAAARAHIAAAFAAEAAAVASITAGTITTTAEIDAAIA